MVRWRLEQLTSLHIVDLEAETGLVHHLTEVLSGAHRRFATRNKVFIVDHSSEEQMLRGKRNGVLGLLLGGV